MEILRIIDKAIGLPVAGLVFLYQKTISPDHGFTRGFYPYGYCKFYPSCSEFARICLREQGISSFPKIIKRLLACRPGVAGGIDHPFKKDINEQL